MKLILCLDDCNGMLFNNRRQSLDRALTAHILQLCAGRKLWMSSYSAKLFGDSPEIAVSDDYLQQAGNEEFVFLENGNVQLAIENARMLIIYRWNRVYPADVKFPGQVPPPGWKCVSKADFLGYSHEKITQEVYSLEDE